jgi:hypothetical protein
VARVVLGEAQQLAGRAGSAQTELRTARRAFDAFGAPHRARQAAGLEGPAQVDRPSPPPAVGVFRLEGGLRTVDFAGARTVVRDLKGYRYLERLLASPGRELHSIDLVAVEHGTLRPSTTGPGDGGHPQHGDQGLPVLDQAARDAYRRRLADIDDDIDDAERMHDTARAELARRDRDYLIAELKGAFGLGGRHRSTGGANERARTSVARTLRYAIERLEEHHPAVAAHLRASLRTGTYCAYDPEPAHAVRWET